MKKKNLWIFKTKHVEDTDKSIGGVADGRIENGH